MVGLQTLDLAIGVRVPASQPNRIKHLRAAQNLSRPFCVCLYQAKNLRVRKTIFALVFGGTLLQVHFRYLVEDALAGVRMLRSRRDINPNQIGLWGGSNGGWVAPLAASMSNDIALVITVAGAVVPPPELVKWRSVNRVRNAGYPDDVVQQVSALMDLQFDLVRREGWERGWEKYEVELQQYRNEPWYGMLSAVRNPLDGSWFMPYTASIDFDPVPVYENLSVPVLAILGDADPLVPAQQTAVILERIKKGKNKDITVVVLAGPTII